MFNEDFENWLTDVFFRRLESGEVDVLFHWDRVYSPHEIVDRRVQHCGLFAVAGQLDHTLVNDIINNQLSADEQIAYVTTIKNEIDNIIAELNIASAEHHIKFYIYKIHLSILMVNSVTMEPQHTVLIRGFEMPHNYSKNYTPKPKKYNLPTA